MHISLPRIHRGTASQAITPSPLVPVMARRSICCLIATAFFLFAPLAAYAQDLTVFAAASLTDALKDITTVWEAQGKPKLRFNFASSSTLARQLDHGAVANLFASADEQWMDWAVERGLIAKDTRQSLLGNRLVLIVPKDKARTITIAQGFDLAELLGPSGRLAVGDPSNVPVGIYAKQALTALGVWATAAPRLAPADSVRSALLLVERGEAPAGIVYETDALVSSRVAVAGTFPEDTHDKITYPFAIPKAGDTPDARAFLTFLAGKEAGELFHKHGFITE